MWTHHGKTTQTSSSTSVAPADSLDDEDEVLWALAEQLGLPDFVAVVGGPQHAHTLLVSEWGSSQTTSGALGFQVHHIAVVYLENS